MFWRFRSENGRHSSCSGDSALRAGATTGSETWMRVGSLMEIIVVAGSVHLMIEFWVSLCDITGE